MLIYGNGLPAVWSETSFSCVSSGWKWVLAGQGREAEMILWELSATLLSLLTAFLGEGCCVWYLFKAVFSSYASPWCSPAVPWNQLWLLPSTSYPGLPLQLLLGCGNGDQVTSEEMLSSGTCNHFLWLYPTQPADLPQGCFPLGWGALSAHWENISISYLHGLGGAGGTISVLETPALLFNTSSSLCLPYHP